MTGTQIVLLILLLLLVLGAAAWFVYRSLVSQRQTLSFEPAGGAITNPLMGWAPWASAKDIQQPHTLVYADLTWREFEPEEGRFDFASFEQRNQLSLWHSKGIRVIFRFLLDVPRPEEHLDIPDWLYERIKGDGDHYAISYGKGFSPNYANPVLIAAHKKAIQALAAMYRVGDQIAFIQLGSLGHWGEWHIKRDAGLHSMPPQAVRDQYVLHYLEAFPNTHLLMRRPFTIARDRRLGLFNDMTGDPDATLEWLEWIAKGGAYSQTGETTALAAMPEGWKYAPVGGEQAGSVSNADMYGTYLPQTLEMLRESHASYIGPRSPADLPPGDPLQPGLDRVLETLGYRIWISRADLPRKVFRDPAATGWLELSNAGIAPISYNWPLQIFLLDSQGQILSRMETNTRLATLLPGEVLRARFALPLEGLPDGPYTIAAAITDPHSGDPAVQFALAATREDRIQIVGSFVLERDLSQFLALP